MSGHSHWAGIKHRKGVNDAKRAKVFTKLARPITIAAREGGGNPDTNFKLRLAIDKAREYNMPKENIDRAIQRGAGSDKDGVQIDELVYEAFGPGNVAIIIKASSENRNRTVSEIKSILTKNGGKFVPTGSVSFLFQEVGEIALEIDSRSYETAELAAIEAGAIDTEYDMKEGILFIYTTPSDLQLVQNALAKTGLIVASSSIIHRPTEQISLSEADRSSYELLLERLNDHDDVDTVYDNAQ
ncbi:MAG: YebC/PmpR family DNA-binding transcriptional regulator [Candidatus Moraniibacteriota bacterium]|nr:MAG: YebC/PmpR family DNA-binding transcriptional regulator [Candidatus Moranbacteria bacterium]